LSPQTAISLGAWLTLEQDIACFVTVVGNNKCGVTETLLMLAGLGSTTETIERDSVLGDDCGNHVAKVRHLGATGQSLIPNEALTFHSKMGR
jgi:hypothetical protein